jgi:hypothetical protein
MSDFPPDFYKRTPGRPQAAYAEQTSLLVQLRIINILIPISYFNRLLAYSKTYKVSFADYNLLLLDG